jgi:glutamate carboxypeptidase
MNPKQLLKTLVETESPSHDKAAVDRVGAIVAKEALELGANVEVISSGETGDHLILRFNPGRQDENKKEPILLLCHMDTVFPLDTLASMPYREADGKIYGPGILDMKAGIVISLGAIEDAGIAGLIRPVTLLCTSDEEIGSPTSRDLIESLATESALVLVMEPALVDGSLKTWRKGVGKFQVTTRGRAAHAGGDHEKGRNAIEEMAHQIITIQKLTDYSKQTTLNVGAIQGGTVSNVVPEQCAVEVDVRVMYPGEWDRLERAMSQLKPVLDGTSIEISGSLNRPPMPFDETMKTTFEKAQAIAKTIGMELQAGGTGGASDANFVAPLGIPVLDGLGAAGEGYHSDREYIFADSLEQKIKLVSSLLRDW